jgi:uncharacterized protein YlxW (UPF0749 family)
VTDLDTVVRQQRARADDLQHQVAALTRQVDTLGKRVDDQRVANLQRRVDELKGPAGLQPVHGPAVTVTLTDAPQSEVDRAVKNGDTTADQLVVHQQDIQAVVNALWKGGASAVTIQGQRVVSTTGIKCEGNAVQLQGVPYPQPYVIKAVGDQASLLTAVEDDSYLAFYRNDAADPDISVGWDLALESSVTAPAYDGLLDLSYATPVAPPGRTGR